MRMITGAILILAGAFLIAGGQIAMAISQGSYGTASIWIGSLIGLAGLPFLAWGAIFEGELGEALQAWGERRRSQAGKTSPSSPPDPGSASTRPQGS